MTTGDLKNNLRKLQAIIKAVKYEKDVDYQSLSRGAATAYLPLYHYAFVDYSQYIAELVAKCTTEMTGKTDLRFIECMYKVLRDCFNYKPPITKEQFFSAGFVEKKVIMCTEILQVVRNKHQVLKPKDKVKVIGPSTSKQAQNASTNKGYASGGSASSDTVSGTGDGVLRPQVVNEIKSTNKSQGKHPERSSGGIGDKVTMQGDKPSDQAVYMVDLPQSAVPALSTSHFISDAPATLCSSGAAKACAPAPQLSWGSNSVHVWDRDHDEQEDNVFDPRRPIDLVAHTPARGVVTAGRFHTDTSIPPTLAETRAEASTETTPQVTTQWVEDLVKSRTQELETRVNNLQATVVLLQHQMSILQQQQQQAEAEKPAQVVADGPASVTAQNEEPAHYVGPTLPSTVNRSPAKTNGYDPEMYTSGAQTRVGVSERTTLVSGVLDFDTPSSSPHRHGETDPLSRTDAHTSFTSPAGTGPVQDEGDMPCQDENIPSRDCDLEDRQPQRDDNAPSVTGQAKRIHDLLKSTEGLLNIEVLSPVKK